MIDETEFIKKVQQFNTYINQKKLSYRQHQREQPSRGAVATHMMDDTYLNPDGSVR